MLSFIRIITNWSGITINIMRITTQCHLTYPRIAMGYYCNNCSFSHPRRKPICLMMVLG